MKSPILVIDDDQEMCAFMEEYLKKEGFETYTATSVNKGLEILKEKKPKVILLDIEMPGINGIDAMKLIHKIDKDIAIIMVTGMLEEDIAKHTIKLGAIDYITKPFSLQYLKDSLMAKLATLD
ncbi:MAG: response regulator [Candidatus Omnitrophota bacterium]